MLGMPLRELTPGEVAALIQGRAAARENAYHERAALQGAFLADMLGFQAKFWLDEEGVATWNEHGPTAELFYKAWTGQLEAEEAGEKTFFTPELEGEEIELE